MLHKFFWVFTMTFRICLLFCARISIPSMYQTCYSTITSRKQQKGTTLDLRQVSSSKNYLSTISRSPTPGVRDFKIRYGKGLLRLHKVKITSGDYHHASSSTAFPPQPRFLLRQIAFFAVLQLHYVSINCHFFAILKLISIF